jgi:hypothetical protein
MSNKTGQHTVSLSEFIERAQELFNEYMLRKYVSAADEREYLKGFLHINQISKQTFGSRVICTVMLRSDEPSFHTLPNRLRLYRGYYEPEKREGISWTLSRKVAEGFAFSPRHDKNGPPRVVTGTCLLSRVLAYSNDRSEEELIVDPKDVRDMRNIKVIAKAHCHIAAEPLDELLKSKQHRRSDYVNIS